MSRNMWMTGHRVELPEMLYGRERRALYQKKVHKDYPGTLVCFTLNIAGPIKVFALSEEIFRNTVDRIQDVLRKAGITVRYHELQMPSWGWEAYFAVDGEAMDVKRALLVLEEESSAGRLFDIDVLRPDGSKVSREDLGLPPRSCLICGQPTIACARSRTHTVEELQNKTADIFLSSLKCQTWKSAKFLGALGAQAMLMEVYTTPKPGLVDCQDNGSHSDMNVALFEASTAAIRPYLDRCAEVGIELGSSAAADRSWEELGTIALGRIRPYGIEAEKAMFAATEGVNTHKGMIFSMGILVCAAGLLYGKTLVENKRNHFPVNEVFRVASWIAKPVWQGDMAEINPNEASLTAGERLYLKYGIGGVRREASLGFPSVRDISWPYFMQLTREGYNWETAGRTALLALISEVTDTNMIKRSGRAKTEELQAKCSDLLRTGVPSEEQLNVLGSEFVSVGASPGGCADLLALTYFLYLLTTTL